MAEQPESRSSLAVGIEWASRITTICLEFALPALLGLALDRYWRTAPTATIIGAVLGFAAGMLHIVGLAREAPARSRGQPRRSPGAGVSEPNARRGPRAQG